MGQRGEALHSCLELIRGVINGVIIVLQYKVSGSISTLQNTKREMNSVLGLKIKLLECNHSSIEDIDH